MKTYNDIYMDARRRLRAAGIAAHDLEARLIVANAAGKTREEFLDSSRLLVTDAAYIDTVGMMMERRLKGEPVAYIVGEWEFYGIPVVVNRHVLIPRIDTELLAGTVIGLIKRIGGQTRLLDLCAGSGCLGISAAVNVPDCRVTLVDNYDEALAVCRSNIMINRVSHSVTTVKADVFAIPPSPLGNFDAIVCNPPYIPTAEINDIDPSVREYEPVSALDGGPDGLDFFRAITESWPVLLKPGGVLAFECGAGQAAALREIMKGNGFVDICTHVDTLGIERVVVGRISSTECFE